MSSIFSIARQFIRIGTIDRSILAARGIRQLSTGSPSTTTTMINNEPPKIEHTTSAAVETGREKSTNRNIGESEKQNIQDSKNKVGNKAWKPAKLGRCTVLVRNIPFTVGDNEIHLLFAKVAKINSSRRPYDRARGTYGGFMFIDFDSEESAKKATETMDGHEIRGRKLNVIHKE